MPRRIAVAAATLALFAHLTLDAAAAPLEPAARGLAGGKAGTTIEQPNFLQNAYSVMYDYARHQGWIQGLSHPSELDQSAEKAFDF
ncbi:MAG: hypothetical protein OHK0022_20260 [Roseiflexaceae bacterium]